MVSINLRGDEKLIYEGKASWVSFWPMILLGILTIWAAGLGIIFFIAVFLGRWQTEYIITNQRAFSKYGILNRKVRDAPINKIQDTAINQTLMGRLLNYGDLSFNTAGGATYEIIFKGVGDPMNVREYAKDVLS